MVEGIEGPRRCQHRHHACWKQERFEAFAGCTDRRGEGICEYVSQSNDFGFDSDCADLLCRKAENGLSFIETSALDASNVEAAFQTILTGLSHKVYHVFDTYADVYS